MLKIDSERKEYTEAKKRWDKVDAFVNDLVKEAGAEYLPDFFAGSDKAKKYEAYKQRAQYVNYSGRVLNISVGQIFRKDPQIKGFDSLKDFMNNVDSAGASFGEFAREVFEEVIKHNRYGVYADWNDTLKTPKLVGYIPQSIINWREKVVNGRTVLSMVMIRGMYEKEGTDKYCPEMETIWTEYFLDESNLFDFRRWRKTLNKETSKEEFEEVVEPDHLPPTIKGKRLDYIPFFFFTSDGISTSIKSSAMYSFVNVNHGHYINSADYENRNHIVAAVTVISSGARTGVKQGDSFPVGGAVEYDDPQGGAKFMEATSDAGLLEAMKHKEEQMGTLMAAMLASAGRYVASAQTASINSQGEYATIADIANAVSRGMNTVLTLCAEMMGDIDKDGKSVSFNTDFETQNMDAQTLAQLAGLRASKILTLEDVFNILKKGEIIPAERTFDEYKKMLEDEEKETQERRKTMAPKRPAISGSAPVSEPVVMGE